MSLIVRCKGCGCVLYSGLLLVKFGTSKFSRRLMTPRGICDIHKWRCPNCGRTLELSKVKVVGVSSTDEP